MSFQTRESLLESMLDGDVHSDWLMSGRVLRSLERDGFVTRTYHAVSITPEGSDYIQNWHGPRYIHPDWFRRHELANAPGAYQPEQGSRARVR